MDNKSLRLLSAEYRSMLETTMGECTPEVNTLELEVARKTDACQWAVEDLRAEELRWAEEEEYARKRKKAFAAARERLTTYVKDTIQIMGLTEISGENYKAKLVRNGGVAKLEIDESRLSAAFWTEVVTKVPNKEAIRSFLESGLTLEGCTLSRGYSLKWVRNLKEIT